MKLTYKNHDTMKVKWIYVDDQLAGVVVKQEKGAVFRPFMEDWNCAALERIGQLVNKIEKGEVK